MYFFDYWDKCLGHFYPLQFGKTLLTLSFNTSKDPYTIQPLSSVVFPLSEIRFINLHLLSASSYLLTVPLNNLNTNLPDEIIPVHKRMFAAYTKLPGHKICWAFINQRVSQLNYLLQQKIGLSELTSLSYNQFFITLSIGTPTTHLIFTKS